MNLKKVIIYMTLMLVGVFSTFSASENKSITDLQYNLTANTNQVFEGYKIQFNFEYQALAPITDIENLVSEQITIDFSKMVDDGNDIEYTLGSDIVDINISPIGIVTISFKNLSRETETLIELSGNIVFTVTAKNVGATEEVRVIDNVGNEVTVSIINDANTGVNTNKGSFDDFVEVGDTITYQVLINNQGNTVDTFHGFDSHSAGMEYVEGSFYAQKDVVWTNMDEYFTHSYDEDGNMIVDSTMRFDVPVLLTYDMIVTSQEEIYHNQFEAAYNTEVPEIVGDYVWFDMKGGSWIDYTHGNIEIKKEDEEGKPLAGAEFDIIDSEGNTINHLVTDDSGLAISDNLRLGNYTVVETVAPAGYKIDNNHYPISLTVDKSSEPIVGSVTSISTKHPVEPEVDSGGMISIHLYNEDGRVISGATFGVYDEDGNLLEVITTDENGNATSQLLGPGRYYIQQQNSVNGYLLDNTKYWFTIGEGSITTEYNVVNQKIEGTVQMYNTDSRGNGLSLSTFNLYDENDQLITSVTTNEYGYGRRILLPYGRYYIQQTSVASGYQLNQSKFSFSITENNQQVNISCINDLAGIELNNSDGELDSYYKDSVSQFTTDSLDSQQIDESKQYHLVQTSSRLQAVLAGLSLLLAAVVKAKLVLKNRDI